MMRVATFVAKLAFLAAVMGATYVTAQRTLARGYVDYFYTKFTGKASGLVIGTSRESDGVVPAILEACLAEPGAELEIENFAFAYRESDFGEMYLDAIRRKLDPATQNGVFVVGVNPASLSQPRTAAGTPPDDSQSRVAQMSDVTADPNLEYIRRFYGKALYKAFTRTGERFNLRRVHPDGWVEVRSEIPGYAMSESDIAGWRAATVETMVRDVPYFTPSPHRLDAFGRILDLLGRHGRVWVIRMPIHPDIRALERDYWPDFRLDMTELAAAHGAEFFDYSTENDEFPTYDGSHLTSESARAFTRRICSDFRQGG